MFYRKPDENDDIKQGDIFKGLPFTELDLEQMVIIDQRGQINGPKKWEEVKNLDNITAKIKLVETAAIVISQDCDNVRNNFISLARIQTVTEITRKNPENTKTWIKLIIKGPTQSNYQWFYLRDNRLFGFSEKMAANFDVIFQLPRESLLDRRGTLRKASLTELALKHFRDSLVRYFTRYAHDEWYSLSKDEFKVYKEEISRRDPDEAARIVPYENQK